MLDCNNCGKQINEDAKYCPYCGVEQISLLICQNCNTLNDYGSKFCAECGQQIGKSKKRKNKNYKENKDDNGVEPFEEMPNTGITVEFDYSSSQSYPLAVKHANKQDSYRQFGEGKKTIHRVNIAEAELEKINDLLEALKGWRNRRVYLNGEQIEWENIFGYSWCFRRRKNSYRPEVYCFGNDNDRNGEFNIWGCFNSQLGFQEYSELFAYGEWVGKDGDWKFDKERILYELENSLYQFRYCPALNFNFVKEILQAFPDIVNPNKDKDWVFDESDYEDGLPVKMNRYGEEETLYMKGVLPRNRKSILKAINSRLQNKLPEKIVK